MECRCVGSNCLERKGHSSFLIVLLSGVKQQFDPVAKEKPREPGSSNGLQPDSPWPEQDELGQFHRLQANHVPDVFLWSRLPVKKINYFDLVSRGQMVGKIVKTTPSLRMK